MNRLSAKFLITLLMCDISCAHAQFTAMPSVQERAAIAQSSAAERDRELKLLGISAMRAGATAYDIGKPGNANYDEALANPYPHIPELLTTNGGAKVSTLAQWQNRRQEIKALFDENVYGKYPANIPKVIWTVTGTETADYKGIAVTLTHAVGHVDNSADPAITVDIKADVVTPAAAKGKGVPVIIGGGTLHPRPFVMPPPVAGQVVHRLKAPDSAPDSLELLLKKGWGSVTVNSNEVQADNGAGLDKGIIGLTNKGHPRKLDDWGVLRAWAWADSRVMDFLETDFDVDAKKVGVMGHSRGGKAALVALVDDPRFAVGFISSSGAGGADLYRRNYGETTANIAGTQEFHWFAGNFMRYAAVGHTANEMPVDSHEFIALAAPRGVFIGGGDLITDPEYAPGDAWQDARGMFMAAVAASPAWRFYGRQGLETATFPPMETFLENGDIAFRQHPFGHTPAPNWPYFIAFADKVFSHQP